VTTRPNIPEHGLFHSHRRVNLKSYITDYCHPDDGGDALLRNVGSYKSQRRHIPEDGILDSHRRENLKP
jgi:hypothetical protein